MKKWFHLLALLAAMLFFNAPAVAEDGWTEVDSANLSSLGDDDVARHTHDPDYFKGIGVSQIRFSEAGFDWHLIRFVNLERPDGPLLAVPHDDENAAFDAALEALKLYGGVAIMVNSGPGSSRMQLGRGSCGGRPGTVTRCDPNRNFSSATPLFTGAYLDQLPAGQPIIALHTNTPGFGKGLGNITILDSRAAAAGQRRARFGGHFGHSTPAVLDNPDTYAILPYLPPDPPTTDIVCRNALVDRGVHVWHEPVRISDGSLSNFVVKSRPDIRYVNMESRREDDLKLAADRHRLMIDAYFNGCIQSGN